MKRKAQDVFPQYLTAVATAPAGVDDYAVADFPVPIIRPTSGSKQVTIMELLKAKYYVGLNQATDLTTICGGYISPVTFHTQSDTCDVASVITDLSDARCMLAATEQVTFVTSGAVIKPRPLKAKWTGPDGRGILYAQDRMVFTVINIGNTAAEGGILKLVYRWATVGIEEYLGIISSQQRSV